LRSTLVGLVEDARRHERTVVLLLLALLLAAGAYVRLAGITQVGFANSDDFYYYRWAYDWFRGLTYTQGSYRLAIPFFGAVSIAVFGPNDYAIHAFTACVGVANVLLAYFVVRALAAPRWLALAVCFVHGLSRRVVEFDRTEPTTALTEFFFLMAVLLFVQSLRSQEKQGSGPRQLLLLAASGLSLCVSGHTHWDMAAHAVSLMAFLLFYDSMTRFSLGWWLAKAATFSAAFFAPILAGMCYYGPQQVLNGIMFGKYILQLTQLDSLQQLGFFPALAYIYQRVIVGPVAASVLSVLFLLALPLALLALRDALRQRMSGQPAQGDELLLHLPLALTLVYTLSLTILRINTEFRQPQHLSPLVLLFVGGWLARGLERMARWPKARLAAAVLIPLVVVLQMDPRQVFTDRFRQVSVYRTLNNVLAGRVDGMRRLLIAPYTVLDCRYQVLTPPSYFVKDDVDHIFEYTDDLPLDAQLRKHRITYVAFANGLTHKESGNFVGVRATLGKVYGLAPEAYSESRERELFDRALAERGAQTLYRDADVAIYELEDRP